MTNERMGRWLAPMAAVLSLAACYGTLAAIALLGALGVTIALNQAVWAGAIVVFAWAALLALWLGRRRHGRSIPLAVAALGAGLITFTMLVSYDRLIELAGFALLGAGTFLDWKVAKEHREQNT